MTPAEFRRLALSLPGAEERAHMGHPDFRVGGKIFATLGYPDAGFGTVMLSPRDQDFFVRAHPKVFVPAAGAWGRAGSTSVRLRAAPRRAVVVALEAAWRRRAPKKLVTRSTPRRAKTEKKRRSASAPTGSTVSAYIASAAPTARKALKQLRSAVKRAAPGITERISYRVPTFELDGKYLLYIAAFKEHVGVYPVTPGMEAKYGKAIAPFRRGKATLRFSLDQPIPVELVEKLARVRVQERRRSR